jgi:hypothetical protein
MGWDGSSELGLCPASRAAEPVSRALLGMCCREEGKGLLLLPWPAMHAELPLEEAEAAMRSADDDSVTATVVNMYNF